MKYYRIALTFIILVPGQVNRNLACPEWNGPGQTSRAWYFLIPGKWKLQCVSHQNTKLDNPKAIFIYQHER